MSVAFLNNLSPKKSLILGAVAGLILVGIIAIVLVTVVNSAEGDKPDATPVVKTTDTSGQQSAATNIVPSDKPVVELFIMSYCPYGTQMQKAFLPVMKLLGEKADIKIKFVDYTMHGDAEARENNREYCIQKDYSDKFVDYMTCFLDKGGQDNDVVIAESCMSSLKIDKSATDKCMSDTVTTFKIQGTDYPVYAKENTAYGVSGSPTLVINGARVSPSSRSPEAVKTLICSAFTNKPAECDQALDTTATAPGFGLSATGSNTDASCN